MQSRGLIHRDLEPANILVNRQGVVKIVDFGLACVVDDGSVVDPKCNLVVDGMLSPDYAALELAAGRDVDGRADIYSLGAVLYFCLTGRPPLLEGTVAQKLQWLQTRRPEPILSLRPETPPALAAIAERMLSADPADRFPSAKDVAEALRPWTRQPIAPPADDEMPRWSPAALKIIGRAGM
jgi:serine/threonine-protein kinase